MVHRMVHCHVIYPRRGFSCGYGDQWKALQVSVSTILHAASGPDAFNGGSLPCLRLGRSS